MAKKTKHSDYFGNRFDVLGSTVRKFQKKNSRSVLAAGLLVGFTALAGLGYLVFSGGSLPEQTIQTIAPVEQEIAREQPTTPAMTAPTMTARQERIQKLFQPKKKISKNKRAQGKKIAKRTNKANLICINPALLKTNKKVAAKGK